MGARLASEDEAVKLPRIQAAHAGGMVHDRPA
jgi:hypothetical protein